MICVPSRCYHMKIDSESLGCLKTSRGHQAQQLTQRVGVHEHKVKATGATQTIIEFDRGDHHEGHRRLTQSGVDAQGCPGRGWKGPTCLRSDCRIGPGCCMIPSCIVVPSEVRCCLTSPASVAANCTRFARPDVRVTVLHKQFNTAGKEHLALL